MVAIMLLVASKMSLSKLGYLCASAALAWPVDKTMQKERRRSFCKEERQEQMEEHRKEQANKLMDACARVHIRVKERTCAYVNI